MSACFVDRSALARLIETKQRREAWSLRRTAVLLGVSASSLSRAKRGDALGGDALVTVLAWLGVQFEDVTICEWRDG